MLDSTFRYWTSGGRVVPPLRTSSDVRELLLRAANPPTVDLFPRSDGPGSSQDLPQFAAMGQRLPALSLDLHDSAWSWSSECLRTPGACIDGPPIRYRAVPAEDPNAFEYYSPDFHDRPISITGPVRGEVPLFVNNILSQFGLTGVRIEADPMPSVYRGTGLGGSNLAHAAALCLASALTGIDLSLGQIYISAIQLENYFGISGDEESGLKFGVSLTGGQEALTALQGGLWDNVHLPMMLGPGGVVSRELCAPEHYDELEQHLLLVNVGQRRGSGVTSTTVSNAWMLAWGTADGAKAHHEKRQVAYQAAEAMRARDWATYAHSVGRYRELRTQLCPAYITGQDELAALCLETGAEYFPLGGGLGTCLVVSEDASAIARIREVINASADPSRARTTVPFRVRSEGAVFHHFAESGLNVPTMS